MNKRQIAAAVTLRQTSERDKRAANRSLSKEEEEAKAATLRAHIETLDVKLLDKYKTLIVREIDEAKTHFPSSAAVVSLAAVSAVSLAAVSAVSASASAVVSSTAVASTSFPFNYPDHLYWSNASDDMQDKNQQFISAALAPEYQLDKRVRTATQDVASIQANDFVIQDDPGVVNARASYQLDSADSIYTEYLSGDNIFTIGSDSISHNEQVDLTINLNYKLYYQKNAIAKCLIDGILFYNLLKQISLKSPHPELICIMEGYKADYDSDDAHDQAETDLFKIKAMYKFSKEFMRFILTGEFYESEYIQALIKWITEGDDRAPTAKTAIEVSELLYKRTELMTELLWYSLFNWGFTIPTTIPNLNIKLYSGIGQDVGDANYADFVNPVLTGNPVILGSCMVSTSYSFDAAANFCKGRTTTFNMLEFILGPGMKLPVIASSANEAEILLNAGNIYRYIKKYYLTYKRSRPGAEESNQMRITVYQFELINDTNETGKSYKDFSGNDDYDHLGGGSNRKRTRKRRKRRSKSRKSRKGRKGRRTNKSRRI